MPLEAIHFACVKGECKEPSCLEALDCAIALESREHHKGTLAEVTYDCHSVEKEHTFIDPAVKDSK